MVALWLRGGFGYVNLVAGVGIIILAVVYRKVYKARIIRIEQEQIAGPLTSSQDANIPWEDVERMEATKTSLIIHTKNGHRLLINLCNITVHQESEVLPKVITLATSKGVEVDVANN